MIVADTKTGKRLEAQLSPVQRVVLGRGLSRRVLTPRAARRYRVVSAVPAETWDLRRGRTGLRGVRTQRPSSSLNETMLASAIWEFLGDAFNEEWTADLTLKNHTDLIHQDGTTYRVTVTRVK